MTRILRLRLKIVSSIVLVLGIVLAIVLILLNTILIQREMRDAMDFLQNMAINDGKADQFVPSRLARIYRMFPKHTEVFSRQPAEDGLVFPIRLEIIGLRRSFAVKLSETNQITNVIHTYPLPYTTREINEIVDKILLKDDEDGLTVGMLYYIRKLPHGEKLLCIANMQGDLKMFHALVLYSVAVYVFALLLATFFAWILAGFITRPVLDAFLKQKAFVSNAGHELKTPISVIGANIDVLMADFSDNKWLQYIKAENERMGELVKDLLYLARTDADQRKLNASTFDFSALVEKSVLPFESVMFEQGKTLHLSVEKALPCVADEHQIKQVVMILVDNAIKNTESGGVIRVTAYRDGKNNVVKVYNDGAGIAKEDFEKIFERFYRTDASRARKTGGYGLGLPIARTIAQAHRGTISVASKLGAWADFTFVLPRG